MIKRFLIKIFINYIHSNKKFSKVGFSRSTIVYAFKPSSDNFIKLSKNIKNFLKIKAFKFCLSNQSSFAKHCQNSEISQTNSLDSLIIKSPTKIHIMDSILKESNF